MSEEVLGTDLKLTYDDLTVTTDGDIDTVSGRDNLRQALYNRLRTRLGELSDLGHPGYGSRLFDLIGEPNNARTRSLAQAYAKECVIQDPRVKEVESVEVRSVGLSRMDIEITVIPIESNVPLNIVYPFYLEEI